MESERHATGRVQGYVYLHNLGKTVDIIVHGALGSSFFERRKMVADVR